MNIPERSDYLIDFRKNSQLIVLIEKQIKIPRNVPFYRKLQLPRTRTRKKKKKNIPSSERDPTPVSIIIFRVRISVRLNFPRIIRCVYVNPVGSRNGACLFSVMCRHSHRRERGDEILIKAVKKCHMVQV